MIKQLTIYCIALVICTSTASAQKNTAEQPTPFVLGYTRQIQSAVLNETRTLNVYLPEGYSPDSSRTYPVIYLLDGSANEDFIHIAGIVQFLSMIEAIPKSIVVGIANVDRKRDFTFPTSIDKDKKSYPTTGHSDQFIAFIEKELQPYVQQKYKTGARTIIGQSLGGLLATEVLIKKPALFDNYIIISPSLWWNNESLLAAAPAQLTKYSGNNIRVVISAGREGKQMEDDVKQITALLQQTGKMNLQGSFIPMPEEDHLTILHNSVYKALQLLYHKK